MSVENKFMKHNITTSNLCVLWHIEWAQNKGYWLFWSTIHVLVHVCTQVSEYNPNLLCKYAQTYTDLHRQIREATVLKEKLCSWSGLVILLAYLHDSCIRDVEIRWSHLCCACTQFTNHIITTRWPLTRGGTAHVCLHNTL